MRYILVVLTGLMLMAVDDQENKKIFSHIKSFYLGICKNDIRDTNGMSISMYGNNGDYIILKTMGKSAQTIRFGYVIKASGEMVELKQSVVKQWDFEYCNLPKKLEYLGVEFVLVDSFKFGPSVIVP